MSCSSRALAEKCVFSLGVDHFARSFQRLLRDMFVELRDLVPKQIASRFRRLEAILRLF